MLVVITPASDPNLFTVEQARAFVGLNEGDISHDDTLQRLTDRVSAEIYAACRIVRATGSPRTLRRETVRETKLFRGGERITLARRHEIALTSLSVAGSAQDVANYFVEGDSGLITCIAANQVSTWGTGLIVAEYAAGFEDVPADLLGAASDLLRVFYSGDARDPLVKSVRVDVDGLEEVETQYFAGSSSTSTVTGLPSDIMARLHPYRNSTYA